MQVAFSTLEPTANGILSMLSFVYPGPGFTGTYDWCGGMLRRAYGSPHAFVWEPVWDRANLCLVGWWSLGTARQRVERQPCHV